MADIFRPPERLTVSQAAEKYRQLKNPGSYSGPWMNSTTPYLVEPMDVLTSREFTGCVFVGPAQTGKTDALLLNWLAHSVIVDPADMLLYEKSQATGRDFSIRRVDRLHRHSPEVGARILKGRDNDAIFTKMYAGMMLSISWPTINEMSGRPVPRVALTDYDRMPQDIDDEGSPFDLARKRTTSFRSFAMTLAESSPGYTVEDIRALPRSKHEAPPCPGILALYNRGDRRRFYWPCGDCGEWFEGCFHLLEYPTCADPGEAAEQTRMRCPHCSVLLSFDRREEMNARGRWVRDGQKLQRDGTLVGLPARSDIASFWMKGVAAAFVSWKQLVLKYLLAMQEFERTHSEEALKATVNTDQGLPYYPKSLESQRLPEDLKATNESLGDRVVPDGVRFLIAVCDSQKNSWVVQVFGVGVGMDVWVIDRFKIVKSKREDADGDKLWVKPGAYLEDWDLLIEQVAEKTYPLATDDTRVMRVKHTFCDSGGKAGVTSNAYDFWRKLRDAGDGWHRRFALLKGDPKPAAPRTRVSYPDAQEKGKSAAARGDVPVLMINSNVVKDKLSFMLDCKDDGAGRWHFPEWLEDEFYTEMCVEQRTPKGWESPKGYRNEAWDLAYYAVAVCIHLRVEHLDWEKPPGWAAEWDKNDLVSLASQPAFGPSTKSGYDLTALASELG